MTPARSEPSFESSLLLKPVETLILTMLTAGERHGYGIRKDILDHSEGRIELEAVEEEVVVVGAREPTVDHGEKDVGCGEAVRVFEVTLVAVRIEIRWR